MSIYENYVQKTIFKPSYYLNYKLKTGISVPRITAVLMTFNIFKTFQN